MDDLSDDAPHDVPRLARGERRPEVEAELEHWYALDCEQRVRSLRAAVDGSQTFNFETYIHISRQAYAAGDRKLLNLAFEALSKAATPLLLYQAKGKGMLREDREEQVQQILLEIFDAIQAGKADFIESNFKAFTRRRSVSHYRHRKARFEGSNQRIEPTDKFDPIDYVPARLPSQEARALLHRALDKLSEKHRAVFIQFHLFKMTQDEIAQHHGVTVRSVYSWLKAAEAAIGLSGGEDDC